MIGTVYCINFVMMLIATGGKIRWAIRKIKDILAKKKAKKAQMARKKSILKKKLTPEELLELPDEE